MEKDLETVAKALTYIDANDRETWYTIAFALKSGFGDTAFDVWDRWSKQGSTYNPRDAKATWKSAKAFGRITMGSFWHIAKENGWNGEKPAPRKWSQKEMAARRATEKKEREREIFIKQRALDRAQKILRACESQTHPYLEQKGFPHVQGLVVPHKTLNQILKRKGFGGGPQSPEPFVEDALVIPLRDNDWKVTSVQLIFPDGDKHFLHGGVISGHTHILGGQHAPNYILCEGYATAHSILYALWTISRRDFAVGVCFSAHNLVIVAKASRKRLYVVADHDTVKKNGKRPGLEAAKQTGFPYWYPPKEGTDANDFLLEHGVEKLAGEMAAFLKKHEVDSASK